MSRTTRIALLAFAAVAGLSLAACKQPTNRPVSRIASATVPFKPVFSVNELMVMIVDRPGERLWSVEKAGHAPASAEEWYQLENHAVELATAAQLIGLGGTGPNDMVWSGDAGWQSASQDLVKASLAARTAAHNKDLGQLITANGQIVDACEACHKAFKLAIPTGGLFMHHTLPN
jgi:cytochrome c556